jgi:dienelactone hydrolase
LEFVSMTAHSNPILASIIFALTLMAYPAEAQNGSVRERIASNYLKFVPSGEGPFPTIVAIPGCSGVALPDSEAEREHPDLQQDDRLFRGHYLRMSENLRAEGFAVLLIHVHGGEGLLTACRGEIGGERIAEYINESVAWAKTLGFVDASRIHVIGWSMGGGGVLAWLHGPRSESGTVRSVVSIYPDCSNRSPLTNQIPLLLLLGDADDIADPVLCSNLVEVSKVKSVVDVRHYTGARHGFDIEDAPPILEIGRGMTIGYQRAAAEASWREIIAFLAARR